LLLQALKNAGANLSIAMEMGHDNVLFQAAAVGDLALVRHEVEDVGEDVNLVGQRSEGIFMTPLMVAVIGQHTDVAEYLLQRDKINLELATKNQGQTALHFAAGISTYEIVKLLLDHGANINAVTCPPGSDSNSKPMPGSHAPVARCNPGVTPLWVACAGGRTGVVRLLLDHSPKPLLDVCDGEGDTPLMIAAIRGHTEIVQMLVDSGANIYKHDRCYVNQVAVTAASYAAAAGHAESLRIILEADAQKSHFFTCPRQWERLRLIGSDYPEVVSVLSEALGEDPPTAASAADVAAAADTAANLVRLCSLVSANDSALEAHMDRMASHGSSCIRIGDAVGEDNV
jgi:hypothetical protein